MREMGEPRLRGGVFAPHDHLFQLTRHGGRQARQLVLHDVVVGAGLHGRDGGIFADAARDNEEGNVQAALLEQFQRLAELKFGM